MILECKQCKKEFTSKYKKQKYCSLKCYFETRLANRIEKNCEICKKSFFTIPYWLKRDKGKYCSAECQHKAHKKEKIKRVCETCGKIFYLLPLRTKNNRGNYCSISCGLKGHTSWNKGLTKETDIRVKQYGENSGKTRTGVPLSKEHIAAVTKSITGLKCTEEARANYRISAQKRCRENMEYWKNLRKSLNLSPNKKEKELNQILQDVLPGEYKFVGDFSLIIDGKCPDFCNVNGQKKLIELFGDYWHRGENPQDRINLFTPFGWQTLVIWERELKNKPKLVRKLQQFNKVVKKVVI